jgi:hypothetical protein
VGKCQPESFFSSCDLLQTVKDWGEGRDEMDPLIPEPSIFEFETAIGNMKIINC